MTTFQLTPAQWAIIRPWLHTAIDAHLGWLEDDESARRLNAVRIAILEDVYATYVAIDAAIGQEQNANVGVTP
jgi:hypothetical protein